MSAHLESRISGTIDADEVEIGNGVVVEEGAVITGKGRPASRVVLGDFCYVGRSVRVMTPEFVLGDYSKLHADSFAHGVHPLRIGRNCWIGGNTVLDSMGGLDIADNVGIGSGSQLWSHIQFGDVVEGCRFRSRRYLHVQEDAWFVGHCLVSPVKVARRSMALLGSVVTKDMDENRVYAGTPAKDITASVGPQFADVRLEDKVAKLEQILEEFERRYPTHEGRVRVAQSHPGREEGITYLDPGDRTYTRTLSAAEAAFLGAYTPLVKLSPKGAPPVYDPGPPHQPDDGVLWGPDVGG